MQKSTRAARMLPPGHGQTIYAYCNIRTNQVLYSLERTLRQSHLTQLADVGANNNPPKLRKDIWRPLFTVSLPDQRQGLDVFKSLREYRMLHETNWELTKEITTPYTEKQIEALKKKLEDRGGSKKETVFDVIKRQKQKMRVKMVMDQKANSVADLAAILLRQEEKGISLVDLKAESVQQRKEQVVAEIEELARAFTRGGTEALDKKIAELKEEAESASAKSKDKSNKVKQRKEEHQKAKKSLEALGQVKLQRRKMLYAAQAVKEAKETAAQESAAQGPPSETSPSADATENTTPPTSEVDYRQYIQPYPTKLDPVRAAQEGLAVSKRSQAQQAQKEEIKLARTPIFNNDGVAIKWANSLDAEYAEMWPKAVLHENMGFVRNAAPVPDQPIAEQISDFKAQQWKTRPANWDAAQNGQQEEAIEPVAEGESVVETETAETAQAQDRAAVLADVKRQILDDVRYKVGKPVWVWQRGLAMREKRERRLQGRKATAQPTGGETQIDATPAEPTSAENAPTL
ncbi:Putative mitochondrial recombination protein [Septoria linicola]|uniref:Large ribosomal subunit protein mL67 n=1 Tax=Septoria linicola TaxID=215465 RepID=A0A9Q9EH88_9PEZI|nr:putative mitochondrial recombination protein [Septoria linicola]USW49652.1 Putative mitochondrial recombination protein [Septoria linicola]